jgi:hypothetical protein
MQSQRLLVSEIWNFPILFYFPSLDGWGLDKRSGKSVTMLAVAKNLCRVTIHSPHLNALVVLEFQFLGSDDCFIKQLVFVAQCEEVQYMCGRCLICANWNCVIIYVFQLLGTSLGQVQKSCELLPEGWWWCLPLSRNVEETTYILWDGYLVFIPIGNQNSCYELEIFIVSSRL